MSELAKRESTPIFTDGWDDTAAEAESRVIRGSLLKFSEGRWTIGTENEAVKEGRQLVAVANSAAWVKWQGGKPVEYRVREPGVPLPEREVLGDCDRAGWENGSDGQPRDPWQNTRFVHLIDPQTAEAFTFSTSSGGGIDCVINLADQIKRMRSKHPNAVPLVELGAAPMRTKHGWKSKPMLRVVGWRNTAVTLVIEQPEQLLPAPVTTATSASVQGKPINDMDDDIPF
jgi:hypothetical protein